MEQPNLLSALLSDDGVKELSNRTKADPSQVQNVLTTALPHLLKGIGKQAEDASTSNSLAGALADHSKKDISNIGSFLRKVDVSDGTKIIGHLLGSNKDTVVSDIAKKTGVNTGQVMQMLSSSAPLIMSLVGKQTEQSKDASSITDKITAALSAVSGDNNLLGQVVGGLFKSAK